MRFKILDNRHELISETLNILVNRINNHDKDRFVLGLSTGLTVFSVCQKLTELVKDKKVSLKNVVIFYAGEFVGYSKGKRHHYCDLLFSDFFEQTDINIDHIYMLDGTAEDLDKECLLFEEKISTYGGIDLFIGSLGEIGELAFNEPGSSLRSKTRLKTLTKETRRADARFFNNDITKVPHQALAMGVDTIFHAREVIMVVYGVNKAFAVRDALERPVSEMQPASVFQLHEQVRFLVDKVASRLLTVAITNNHNE